MNNPHAALEKDHRFNDADTRATNDEELQEKLSQIFSTDSRDHWKSTLEAGGVSVIKNEVIEDFRNDPSVRKAGLIATRDHPGLGQADHLGVAARLSNTPARLGRPSPVLGADTTEILEEIGYGSEEIKELESARIVVQAI